VSEWIEGTYKVYSKSKVPTNIKVIQTSEGALISWNAVKGAKSYQLYAKFDDRVIQIVGSPSGSEWKSKTSYLLSKSRFKDKKEWYFAVSADNGPISSFVKFVWKDVVIDSKYKQYLAGKTLYAIDKNQTIHEWYFADDLSELVVDDGKFTITLEKHTNGLKISKEENKYFIIKSVESDYLLLEYAEITDEGVFIGHIKTIKLYFKKPNTNIDLKSLVVGKTYYQYCTQNKELFSITFNSNGKLIAQGSKETQEIPYKIEGNTLYTTENGKEKAHDLTSYEDNYIWFGTTEDGKFYTNEADARANPVSNCDGDDENFDPQGTITYRGENYKIKRAKSYMSSNKDNNVQIFLKTYNHGESNDKGSLQLALSKNKFSDNQDLKKKKKKGTLYLRKDDLAEHGLHFWTANDKPTGVKWRSGSIKLTWLGNDKFAIEQNGAGFVIPSEDPDDNVAYPIYFTKTIVQWTDENHKNEEYEIKITNLISGHVSFDGGIPSDAWIRITPKQYQENGNWNGLNCKINSNGDFGSECYIDYNEEGIRNAFNNSSTKYQIVVYKNHIEPNGHHWNSGEDVYKYVGNDLSSSNWVNIIVKDEDYQDRSSESCGEDESNGAKLVEGKEITLSGLYIADALTYPNGGEEWSNGNKVVIKWDKNNLMGDTVSMYILWDNPSDILQAIKDNSELNIKEAISNANWGYFANTIQNTGSYEIDPSILRSNGDAYMILVVSSNGDWDISNSTFSVNNNQDDN